MLIYIDTTIVQYCADYESFIFGEVDGNPAKEPRLAKELSALRRLVELEQVGNWDFAASTVSTSGKLSPAVKFYDPNGKLLKEVLGCCPATYELQPDPLPVDGTYVIIVGDGAGTHTGTYALNLQKIH